MACLNGHIEVVTMLLSGGECWEACSDVNIEDEFGRTPLHAAASVADVEVGRIAKVKFQKLII